MNLQLQPVRVANGYDEEGLLVFVRERLVAVLVRLSDQHAEWPADGSWRRHLADLPDLAILPFLILKRPKSTSHPAPDRL